MGLIIFIILIVVGYLIVNHDKVSVKNSSWKEKFSNLFKKDGEDKTKEFFGKVFSVVLQIATLLIFVVIFRLIFPGASMALWTSGVFLWLCFLFLFGFLLTKVAKLDLFGFIIMLISIVFAVIVMNSGPDNNNESSDDKNKKTSQKDESRKLPETIWVDFPEKGKPPVTVYLPCGSFLSKPYKGSGLSISYKIITPFGEEIRVENGRNKKSREKSIGGTYTIVSLNSNPGKIAFYGFICD